MKMVSKTFSGENTQKEYEGFGSMSIRAKFSFMLGAVRGICNAASSRP